jgi:hypothetical protein
MRLTVHVKDAKKRKVEVRSKDKTGTTFTKEVIYNTLSFVVKDQSDANRVLSELEGGEYGIPVKHYLSSEKVPGRVKKKKKS